MTRARFPVLLLLAVATLAGAAQSPDPKSPISVRITSPLGRSGVTGTVRIVAQLRTADDVVLGPVQFFVDGALLATDDDGPPYDAEWLDDNPFQPRDIAVEVRDELGRVGRDEIHLNAFEIVELKHVNSVLLEASVQDAKGRFVTSLRTHNFVVEENGVVQELQLVRQETVPTTFALLVDASHSMHRRIDFVRRAAARLTEYLKPHDRVLVAPFSARLGAITGPTDDRTTVLEAIEAIKPGGGTAILDVLAEMSRRLPATDGEGRRVLVLLTDGYDENSRSTPDAALADVRASGATLYTVGIGGIAGISLRGERMLRRLAGETGGRSFFPPREADLDPTYDLLVADAQNRYLLSYTPTNQVADGTWRAITVRTVPEPLRIRARNGYQAPSPPPVRPSFEFTVTDLAQQYTDVTVDDLEVVEDGVRQTVESFQEAVLPVSIVLALDASGSMRRSADTVVQAARRFVESVRPQDSLAVVLFADQSVFAHDLSANRENSLAAIDSYVSAGGTALYDALSDSLIRLRRAEGRRVVVVMTDGRDENAASTGPGSRATFDRVRELARETGAIVFGIGLGTRVDRAPLEELARLTGGDAYFPTDVSELTDQYARIVENLRRRFVLSYTSTNARRDGSWRKVAIHSRLAGLQVKGPDGYFAPAQ